MNPIRLLQRRTFLGHACRGVGSLALTSLLAAPPVAAQRERRERHVFVSVLDKKDQPQQSAAEREKYISSFSLD